MLVATADRIDVIVPAGVSLTPGGREDTVGWREAGSSGDHFGNSFGLVLVGEMRVNGVQSRTGGLSLNRVKEVMVRL